MSRVSLAVLLGFLIAVLLSCLVDPVAACSMTPREDYNPTGWEGCTVYGAGLASHWDGEGVARNDCLWPWTACNPIRITSSVSGRSVVVQPTMFCDCYLRTPRQRLVDLDRTTVRALGLDWSDGLYRVRVEPVRSRAMIPDTAMR